ncbi:hypothetical protein KA183_13220 [bacterium]|nr:hypothetical protein [bacterium]
MKEHFISNELDVFRNRLLKGIVFAIDYIELVIDDGDEYEDYDYVFTVRSQLTVANGERALSSGASGFRDSLCELVGKTISNIELSDSICIFAFRDDSARLIVSLSMPDSDLYVLAHCEDQEIFLVNDAHD